MEADFTYDQTTDRVERVGHYSQCEPHEATREEGLLWTRVHALEALLEKSRSPDARLLVEALRAVPPNTAQVAMNAEDFGTLRAQARDVVDMVTQPHRLVQRGILGAFQRWEDGVPVTIWILVRRDVPAGSIQVMQAIPLPKED